MEFEDFLEAVNATECCATCKFFDNGNGHVDSRGSHADLRSWSMLGTCRRYPPAMVRQRKGRDDFERQEEFGCPSIRIEVSRIYTGEVKIGSGYPHGFGDDEEPWCGEYQKGIRHEFVNSDKLFKEMNQVDENDLDADE